MNPENSQAALAQLQGTQATAKDPNAILGEQRQALGVNAAQDTVTGLRGAINNTTKLLKQVAPSVMGRTANSLVSNAQATRQIGNESAPIAQNLAEQGQAYGEANDDLGRLEGQAGQAASGIYQGQQDKMSYLQNLYNTLYGKEQDAATAAEQARQFDTEQARLRAGSGGGGGIIPQIVPTVTPKTGGQSNLSLRQQWQQEAKAGDRNAQVALNYAGDDGKYDGAVNSKAEYDVLKAMGIKGNYYIGGVGAPIKTGNITVGVANPSSSGLKVR